MCDCHGLSPDSKISFEQRNDIDSHVPHKFLAATKTKKVFFEVDNVVESAECVYLCKPASIQCRKWSCQKQLG